MSSSSLPKRLGDGFVSHLQHSFSRSLFSSLTVKLFRDWSQGSYPETLCRVDSFWRRELSSPVTFEHTRRFGFPAKSGSFCDRADIMNCGVAPKSR